MGEVQRGYCGPFTGKFGPGIGTYTAGRNFIKSMPIISKNRKSTEAQLEHRAIFKLAFDFLDPMSALLKKTIPKKGLVTGFHQAMKHVIEKAISGTPPVINYSLVVLGKGKLRNEGATVTPAAGTFTFAWANVIDSVDAFADDKSVLVAYCESLKRFSINLNGAVRSSATAVLNLPATFSGKVVQTWIAFITANGKKASESIFTGAVTAL